MVDEIRNKIKNLREDFNKYSIDFNKLPNDPIELFSSWIDSALEINNESISFILSTVNKDRVPTSRVLLLRGFDEKGFVFYTNYTSSKSLDISFNHNVALNFFWPNLQRQIRIIGIANKVSNDESDSYFYSRPRDSQISACVSEQSSIIDIDKNFIDLVNEFKTSYEGKDIMRPKNWGGYRVSPNSIEFWQGKPSRLHDRVKYIRDDNHWDKNRLSP